MAASVLRLADVVQAAYTKFKNTKSPGELDHMAHHGLEVTRECLNQVLLQLKAKLLQWENWPGAMEVLVDLPLPKMPCAKYPNNCWHSAHPRRFIHLADAHEALAFMQANEDALQGEPWQWLQEFLQGMCNTM